jgi:hypothetical protein
VYDVQAGWVEPNPDERERILGLPDGATRAPGVSERDRHRLTGNSMDVRALTGLIRVAVNAVSPSKVQHLQFQPVPPAPSTVIFQEPPTLPHGWATVLSLTYAVQAGECEEALIASDTQLEHSAFVPLTHTGDLTDVTKQFYIRNQDPDPLDITLDNLTLEYIRTGQLPRANLSTATVRRVLRRASRYQFQGERLTKIMSNGHTRQVPPIDARPAIVLQVHSSAGHFGYRRTLHLLLAVYAWAGMSRMVKQLVGACELCHRARASFTGQTMELQPHPVVGMFHT